METTEKTKRNYTKRPLADRLKLLADRLERLKMSHKNRENRINLLEAKAEKLKTKLNQPA